MCLDTRLRRMTKELANAGCGGRKRPALDQRGQRRGLPRRRRAAAGQGGRRGDLDAAARHRGGAEPRPRPLLLRLGRRAAAADAGAVHRPHPGSPAGDVRDRRALRREVAHRGRLHRGGPRGGLSQGLGRARSARLEQPRDARAAARRRRQLAHAASRRARRSDRGVRPRGARVSRRRPWPLWSCSSTRACCSSDCSTSTAVTPSCWRRSMAGSPRWRWEGHEGDAGDRRPVGAGRAIDRSRRRAESRPSIPTPRASPSATGSGSSTRSTARARRPSSCCRPGRWSTPATGRCRSPTSRATSVC